MCLWTQRGVQSSRHWRCGFHDCRGDCVSCGLSTSVSLQPFIARASAVQVLPKLQTTLPIQRARMRLKLTMPAAASRDALHMLEAKNAVIESHDLHGVQDSQVKLSHGMQAMMPLLLQVLGTSRLQQVSPKPVAFLAHRHRKKEEGERSIQCAAAQLNGEACTEPWRASPANSAAIDSVQGRPVRGLTAACCNQLSNSQVSFVFLVEPACFRSIDDFVGQAAPGGQGRLEVVALAAVSEATPDPDLAAQAPPSQHGPPPSSTTECVPHSWLPLACGCC